MASTIAKEFFKKDKTKINALLVNSSFFSKPEAVLVGDYNFLGFIRTTNTSIDVKEITDMEVRADVGGDLDGTFFILHDDVGSVGFWIDVDDSGTTIPAGASAADRAVEITTITTGMAKGAVGTAIFNAVTGDSKFEAGSDSTTGILTLQASTFGPKTDSTAGDTGFTVGVNIEGVDIASIIIKIQHSPDVNAVDADWFDLITFTAISVDSVETIELNNTTDHLYEFVRVSASRTKGSSEITTKLYHSHRRV